MRPPSPRLAVVDPSLGPETIAVNAVAYTQDDEGNPIRTPTAGASHVAVVSRQALARATPSGAVESVEGFAVLVHATTDPGIRVDSTVTWRGLTLWAMTDAVPCGLGAWRFDASDIGPAPG